jgi:hypothetical protein
MIKKILHFTQTTLTFRITINLSIFFFLETTELPCETDGFAGSYDDYQGKTTPCKKEGKQIVCQSKV